MCFDSVLECLLISRYTAAFSLHGEGERSTVR